MKLFMFFISITIISCGIDNNGDIPEGFVAESHYDFDVESSLGGAHSFTRSGVETRWDPDIGHMELGPEEQFTCDNVVASLWMDDNPLIFVDLQSGEIDQIILTRDWKFYSILYWCNDLGDQESNWYEFIKVDTVRERFGGIDNAGVEFFRLDFQLQLRRSIVNNGDEPEIITVDADFTAVSR